MSNKTSVFLLLTLFACGLLGCGLFYWLRSRGPARPATVTLSVCKAVAPGMQRLGAGRMRTAFDVSDRDFTTRVVSRDMPPGLEYVVANKRDSAELLFVSDSEVPTAKELGSAFPTFSEHVEERDVRNSVGVVIGKDRWGYLKSGDRWRLVRFAWGEEVGYRPTPARTAVMWDQVIRTACLSPDPNS